MPPLYDVRGIVQKGVEQKGAVSRVATAPFFTQTNLRSSTADISQARHIHNAAGPDGDAD